MANNHSLPDRSIISLSVKNLADLMKMQREIYPENFVEEEGCIEKILNESDLNIGVIVNQKLAGFLLVTKDYVEVENGLWLYDLGILPDYQRQGLGSLLLSHFLSETHKEKTSIFAYCRDTSYPLFSNEEKLKKMGYRISDYKFIEDGYFEECGVHEDLHELALEPFDNHGFKVSF